MLVDDLLDLLTSGGAGTAGEDLFGGGYSDTPDECIGVFETGGLFSVQTMSSGPGQAAIERPRVQIMVRSTGYAEGRARSQKICDVLDGLRPRLINGVQYHWAQAVTPPTYLGPDANGRFLFSTNYDLLKQWSATS